jgi:hypothetical protein
VPPRPRGRSASTVCNSYRKSATGRPVAGSTKLCSRESVNTNFFIGWFR